MAAGVVGIASAADAIGDLLFLAGDSLDFGNTDGAWRGVECTDGRRKNALNFAEERGQKEVLSARAGIDGGGIISDQRCIDDDSSFPECICGQR